MVGISSQTEDLDLLGKAQKKVPNSKNHKKYLTLLVFHILFLVNCQTAAEKCPVLVSFIRYYFPKKSSVLDESVKFSDPWKRAAWYWQNFIVLFWLLPGAEEVGANRSLPSTEFGVGVPCWKIDFFWLMANIFITKVNSLLLHIVFNTFHTTGLFLYPMKTEN